ncbi:MAG: HDOD domain-containing protein [bacterium]|nr:HDOD domain-containing protein [bacterium]
MTLDLAYFRNKVENLEGLPTLPGVVAKLSALVEKPNTSTAQVGEMISADQVLSAKVLRLINSAFFGFPGKIGTVTHALVLLGFNAVKGLVLTASVFDIMAGEMLALWMHSLGVSVTAGLIARRIGLPDPEEVQVAGLLHDIGKVVLKVEEPDYFDLVNAKVAESNLLFMEAEAEIVGFTHTKTAEWLCDKWNLPASIRDPITLHHDPLKAGESAETTYVVHMADILVRALGFGSGGDKRIPPLNREVVKGLGLSLSSVEEILREMEEEFVKAGDLIPSD